MPHQHGPVLRLVLPPRFPRVRQRDLPGHDGERDLPPDGAGQGAPGEGTGYAAHRLRRGLCRQPGVFRAAPGLGVLYRCAATLCVHRRVLYHEHPGGLPLAGALDRGIPKGAGKDGVFRHPHGHLRLPQNGLFPSAQNAGMGAAGPGAAHPHRRNAGKALRRRGGPLPHLQQCGELAHPFHCRRPPGRGIHRGVGTLRPLLPHCPADRRCQGCRGRQAGDPGGLPAALPNGGAPAGHERGKVTHRGHRVPRGHAPAAGRKPRGADPGVLQRLCPAGRSGRGPSAPLLRFPRAVPGTVLRRGAGNGLHDPHGVGQRRIPLPERSRQRLGRGGQALDDRAGAQRTQAARLCEPLRLRR